MRRYIKRDRFGGLRKKMEGLEIGEMSGGLEGWGQGGSTVEWSGELRVIDR